MAVGLPAPLHGCDWTESRAYREYMSARQNESRRAGGSHRTFPLSLTKPGRVTNCVTGRNWVGSGRVGSGHWRRALSHDVRVVRRSALLVQSQRRLDCRRLTGGRHRSDAAASSLGVAWIDSPKGITDLTVQSESVVWIAVDRYRLIICPLKRRWSASVAAGPVLPSGGSPVSVCSRADDLCQHLHLGRHLHTGQFISSVVYHLLSLLSVSTHHEERRELVAWRKR